MNFPKVIKIWGENEIAEIPETVFSSNEVNSNSLK